MRSPVWINSCCLRSLSAFSRKKKKIILIQHGVIANQQQPLIIQTQQPVSYSVYVILSCSSSHWQHALTISPAQWSFKLLPKLLWSAGNGMMVVAVCSIWRKTHKQSLTYDSNVDILMGCESYKGRMLENWRFDFGLWAANGLCYRWTCRANFEFEWITVVCQFVH